MGLEEEKQKIRERLLDLKAEFRASYGNAFKFNDQPNNEYTIDQLVAAIRLNGGADRVVYSDRQMSGNLSLILALDRISSRLDRGSFDFGHIDDAVLDSMAAMNITLDKLTATISGNELIGLPLMDARIDYEPKTETNVASARTPNQVKNWFGYLKAMKEFYETPEALQILSKRYTKPSEGAVYDRIESHSTMTSCLANYILKPFFSHRMLNNLWFETETTTRTCRADIFGCRKEEHPGEKTKVVCAFEAKLGFVLDNEELEAENVADNRPQENVLLKTYKYLDEDKKGVRANVVQLYTYMFHCQVKYGILSNYDNTWAFKREGQTLFFSQRIPKKELIKNLLFVLYTANYTLEDDQRKMSTKQKAKLNNDGHLATVNYLLMEDFRLGHALSIGQGRCGPVYKIKFNGCDVALKMVDAFKSKDLVKELVLEVTVYSILGLAGVKCVPKLIHSGYYSGLFILVLEYIEGEHIEFHKMNERQKQMCIESLSQLHRAGVRHGDLRSSNFICSQDQVKIIDFGFSALDVEDKLLLEEKEELKRLFQPKKQLETETSSSDSSN